MTTKNINKKTPLQVTKAICLAIVLTIALTLLPACSIFTTSQHSFPHLMLEQYVEQNPIRPLLASDRPVVSFRAHDNSADALRAQLWEILDIVSVQQAIPNLNCPNIFDSVRASFNGAVTVLNRYIRNDFSTTYRLLAIHDFLSYRVAYDYDLFERYLQNQLSQQEIDDSLSFDMRGVFLNPNNRVAVCEGLARAFMLMAGIELIEARTVTGSFRGDGRVVRHMWNTVRVAGRWYNVDVTLNNRTFMVSELFGGMNEIRVLNHGFFLRSDRALQAFGGHIKDANSYQRWPIPPAVGEFNFFANRYFMWDNTVPMQASNAEELISIFRAVAAQNRRIGAIQVQLAFRPNMEEVNDLSIFELAIERAYAAVLNSDFSFSRGQSAPPPFAQYPGGVFVFMIFS